MCATANQCTGPGVTNVAGATDGSLGTTAMVPSSLVVGLPFASSSLWRIGIYLSTISSGSVSIYATTAANNDVLVSSVTATGSWVSISASNSSAGGSQFVSVKLSSGGSFGVTELAVSVEPCFEEVTLTFSSQQAVGWVRGKFGSNAGPVTAWAGNNLNLRTTQWTPIGTPISSGIYNPTDFFNANNTQALYVRVRIDVDGNNYEKGSFWEIQVFDIYGNSFFSYF